MNLKLSLLSIGLFISFGLFAQNFAGTWIGVWNDDMSNPRSPVRFSMQLQQAGRAVWGIYTTGESYTIEHAQCACRINAQMGKKDKSFADLYKDGVISSQIAETTCDFVVNLETNYLEKEGKKYLTGKWFGNTPSSRRSDGASGDFTVVKVSDSLNIDVNKYFPKLDKLIEKANPGDTTFKRSHSLLFNKKDLFFLRKA